ncbi:MAG: hypothetical protein QM783_18350 [Phycisphaerales bacterium]
MKQRESRVWWWGWRVTTSAGVGAVVTVAVAYGGAVNDSELDFGGYGDGSVYSLRQSNRWWDVVTCVSDGSSEEILASVRAVRSWEGDSIAALVRSGATSGAWPRDVIQIGWPARCFWGVGAQSGFGVSDGVAPAPEWLESWRYVKFPLPTRVRWAGLMADTAVFGGPLLVVLCVPGVVRRMRRGRKGLCVACGYDLRGAGGVCPECGAGPAPRSAP